MCDLTAKPFNLFSGNILKIIALIAMTFDHIGFLLLPQYQILRIIGRVAFPIFSYMIAEGSRYTKNRTKYLIIMVVFGVAFQIVYYVADRSLFQGVFISFSLGIALIFAIENAIKRKNLLSVIIAVILLVFVGFVCIGLPKILSDFGFEIDYGIFGVLLPVFAYFMPNKLFKLVGVAVALVGMSLIMGGRQWYSLIAVLLLAFYNGERGKYKMKSLFYLYYPVHLAIIYAIDNFGVLN